MSTFTLQDLNLPMTAEEAIKAVEQAQHAEPPQPTQMGEVLPKPDVQQVINNICTQLQLLATVIGEQARNTTPPEGNPQPLQETIELVLQQSGWFEELVKRQVESLDITAIAKDAVQEVVESEVDSYFEVNFDPSEHFDFSDAVNDAVNDRIDDAVEAHMDDAVENYMSNATITISK